MSVLAEMSWENPLSLPKSGQMVLTNIEINNHCAFTKACGDNCYLNLVRSGNQTLPEEQVFEAASAMIQNGAVIRHMVVAGKEPFESPELLMRIAARYRAETEDCRPGSLGAISASVAGIKTWLPQMNSAPLSWLAVSVDAPTSGMRSGDSFRVLDAAMAGRDAGGTESLSVNTIFQEDTLTAVEAIGKALRGRSLDQWAVAPLLLPVNGTMTATDNFTTTSRMIRIAESLVDVASRVVVETELSSIRRIIGEARFAQIALQVWRVEVQLDSGIWLLARPPVPGYFLRLRHDGALLSKDDFTKIGLTTGRYGVYRATGDIKRVLTELQREREESRAAVLRTTTDTFKELLAA